MVVARHIPGSRLRRRGANASAFVAVLGLAVVAIARQDGVVFSRTSLWETLPDVAVRPLVSDTASIVVSLPAGWQLQLAVVEGTVISTSQIGALPIERCAFERLPQTADAAAYHAKAPDRDRVIVASASEERVAG